MSDATEQAVAADSPPIRAETNRHLPLFNRGFSSFLATQFLGAFNDNVFKQAVLLLAVSAMAVGRTELNFQSIVNAAFVIPFVLFSGLAGDIADRFSKGTVMVVCKAAEIFVMGVGIVAFMMVVGANTGESALWALAVLAFVMGTQSAFFGPPKYAGIPEMVKRADISTASGLTQMTTMIAIVVGIGIAGWLLTVLGEQLWLIGVVCTGLAIVGTITALGIVRKPASNPQLKLGAKSTLSMFPTLVAIWKTDRTMILVGIAYSYFWLLGAWALLVINEYGILQLGIGEAFTSLMVATISLGIGGGSLLAGVLSKGRVRLSLIVPGAAALATAFIALALLPVAAPQFGADIERVVAPQWVVVFAFVLCAGLGAAGGLYSVPLLAFIQTRPRDEDKGRVIALMAFSNWVFILSASVIFAVVALISGHRAEVSFAVMGGMTILVALLVLPAILRAKTLEQSEMQSLFIRRSDLVPNTSTSMSTGTGTSTSDEVSAHPADSTGDAHAVRATATTTTAADSSAADGTT